MDQATTATTSSAWSDWFDRINAAAQDWYSIYRNQPTSGQQGVYVTVPRDGGLSASISPGILIAGAVIVIGAIYVWKKA